jgi:S1-C subfamily serine protease
MVINAPEKKENLPFLNNQSPSGSMGTCFIVSYKNKKFVITNHHVVVDSIKNKNTTKIIFYGNYKTYSAILVGKDKMSDIAVLKMDTLEGQTIIRDIRGLQWGNSNNVRQGDDAWAVGHPMQQIWSVSKGIISYIGRRIHNIRQELIQSDVAINSGNSGGPLLNMKGEVIGVNTFIASRQNGGQLGVNFSVTSNLAKRIMKQLIDTGLVKSPKIGVLFQIDHDKGLFIIKAVEPGSPIEAAGIQDDDLIVKINGHDIYLIDDMGKALDHVLPGDEIEIVILRGDEIIKRIVKTTKIDDN